jgi:branched-chain amino acid transport system ATP-binding protein
MMSAMPSTQTTPETAARQAPGTSAASAIRVRGLRRTYGEGASAFEAVRGVDLDVPAGSITALLGTNGAGKTSTLRAISGLVRYRGQVRYRGADLHAVPPHEIVARGIAHVPEGRGIFGELTVMENLRLASWVSRDKAALQRATDRVFELFPRMKERRHQLSGTLSGGEQQMLPLSRALITEPRVLLLDEPSMGLAPLLVRDIFRVLVEINRAGTTIVLIEQNAYMGLRIAHRAHVLETGAIVLSGSGRDLMSDERVRMVYLGG